uniref:COMM domain-containing protein n=1 Tax=Phlebotomus kandelakii TaxID=1109342 RepID=A0A6B2ENR3_9DIPT
MHEISINIDNIEILTEFLNSVIDGEVFGELKGNAIKSWKYYGFSHQDEVDLARKSVSNIIVLYSRGQMDQCTLKSYFSYLSRELQERIVAVLESRREEILRRLIFVKLSSEQKVMESFDWEVKWIIGSSSSSIFQKIITSLTLNCRKGSNSTEKLHLEMDRQRLDELIKILEDCESRIAQQ